MVAFVVGMGNYNEPFQKLVKPVKDAKAIRDVLKDQNAEVYFANDCGVDEFEESFGLFLAAVRPGDAAFLFYAGHAVMLKNSLRLIAVSNYSASTDKANPSTPDIVESNSLNLDTLVAR